MSNNENLRRIRYALDLRDQTMIDVFAAADIEMTQERLLGLFKQEEAPGHEPFSNLLFGCFLDGLISTYRGKRTLKPGQKPPPPTRINNNNVLRALKIALELREPDMLEIMALGGMRVSKNELSALFRKPDHRNYKACGDQFLRTFLTGLGKHRRQ